MIECCRYRSAILALEPGNLGETILDLAQALRREFKSIRKITQRKRNVLEHCPRRFQSFEIVAETRFVLRQFLQLFQTLPDTRQRRIVVLVNAAVTRLAKRR